MLSIGHRKDGLDDVAGRLNSMVEKGEIEPWVRGSIVRYVRNVLEHLTGKYSRVAKEAKEIMGGYIIRTDIDEAMEKGIEKGIEQGIEKGIEQGEKNGEDRASVSYIRKVMNKMKYSAQQAMDFLDLSAEEQKYYAPLLKESAENSQ